MVKSETTTKKRPVPAKRKSANPKLPVNDTKIPSKKRRVLSALIEGESFNRFEAERQLNDHVANTTISELQAMGITISRCWENVPGYLGLPTRVRRYWIAEEHRERATKVLEGLR